MKMLDILVEKLTYNFEFHSNEMASRKGEFLGWTPSNALWSLHMYTSDELSAAQHNFFHVDECQ